MKGIDQYACLIGTEAGLNRPSGICMDVLRKVLYICDLENARVLMYSLEDGTCRYLTGRIKPLAITLDTEERPVITDAERNSIFRYQNGGWAKLHMGERIHLNLPGSIASDSWGNLYISDFHNGRIIKWEGNGRSVILPELEGKQIYGIYCRDDILYLADAALQRIGVYHIAKRRVAYMHWKETSPIAVTADEKGTVYFSENRRIYCCDPATRRKELILSRENWKESGFDKLGHIGALMPLSKDCLLFSDTIKNKVYTIRLVE